jgi:hydroxymethylpyrimidine/phosphomethylpyrimidine kinase
MKNVLTIAGSDSCGGAGIQADIKTFCALGTYGMSVITAVTAQNTRGVAEIREMDSGIVAAQIDCIFDDIRVDAVKIGMVSSIEIIGTIAERLVKNHAERIILDPVMISKSGYNLLKPESKKALIKELFPLALLVTPNLFEAEAITGRSIGTIAQMESAAKDILTLGARSVVIKGGHLEGDAVDVFYDGENFEYLSGRRIDTKNTHGTGCTFSSAVAALTAKGYPLPEALRGAKAFISTAIEHSITLGAGPGPTNHFYSLYKAAGVDVE